MESIKDLNYYKNNCEEDYVNTPISVLRYITELEQALQLQQTSVVGRSEQLSCDTCIWKNRTYVRCGVCNNYDKYEKAT